MKTLRFVTIMLTALSMGAAFAHLLEMPAKRKYDGPLWLRVQQTLYRGFGAVAGPCEVAAVPAGVALIVANRKRPRAFPWTVLGASCAVAT